MVKRIFIVFVAVCVMLASCSFGTAVIANAQDKVPTFSLSLVSETDKQAVVSINLEDGSFYNSTFIFVMSDKISACTKIVKTEFFKSEIGGVEVVGGTVISAFNVDEAMVTIASTDAFDEKGEYFEVTFSKATPSAVSKDDIILCVSDVGARVISRLAFGCGDVNSDNRVNSADALAVLKHCTGVEALSAHSLERADTDYNEIINSRDAYYILQYINGEIEEFSEELQGFSNNPVFTCEIYEETDSSVTFSLSLKEGGFNNGTFSITTGELLGDCVSVGRTNELKDISLDVADKGGTISFNSNKSTNTVSIASTEELTGQCGYFLFTFKKLSDTPVCSEDISVKISDIDARVENRLPVVCRHSWVAVSVPATCTKTGEKYEECEKCGEKRNLTETPCLLHDCKVVDSMLVGLAEGLTLNDFANKYFIGKAEQIELASGETFIGTGTVITVNYSDASSESFTAVVAGDTDGNGICDAQDSVIVSCITEGLYGENVLSKAVYLAADCNGDNAVDSFDSDYLISRGLLLK